MSPQRKHKGTSSWAGFLPWWLFVAFVYFWPFGVWSGKPVEWAVGVPWLIISVSATIALSRYKKRQSRIPAAAPVGEKRTRQAIPREVRQAVWARDGQRCRHCGIGDTDAMLRNGEHLHYDHIVPHSRNGADTVANLQLLCGPCNRTKAARYTG